MVRNLVKTVVFSFIFTLSSVALVRADGPEGWNKGACKDDVQKLCANVKPGQGSIRDCMKQHESELSPACKSNVAMMKEKMQERMAAINTACKADEDQFCKDVTPGEGREMACLHAHNDKLSAGCKDAINKNHPKHMGMKKGMGGPATDAPMPPQ